MNRPVEIQRYIALKTKSPLETDLIKSWFRCVQKNSPPGCLMSLQLRNPNGGLESVSLVHRKTDGGHLCIVPLGRDLSTVEAEKIFNAWMADNPDMGDYDIESSASIQANMKKEPPVLVSKNRYDNLSMALAKKKHEAWVRERTDQGWRYATTLSMKNKTHPLLRPWDQLPEKYRTPDKDSTEMVMDLLSGEGYAVVDKDDLQAVKRVMNTIS